MILRVLDWRHGFFELTAGQPTAGMVEFQGSVTHLLLEHARRSDEATKPDDESEPDDTAESADSM